MEKELDLNLLKRLYKIHSPSENEKRMRRFIKRFISDNVRGASVVQDGFGNLLVTKGEAERYPCLCAHMDQVQNFHPKDFVCVEDHGVIFGYSPKTHKQCGLGADDKNGIFVALTCLKKYDNLKCAFFVGEEIGCVGSEGVDVSFFDNCTFCAQIDRRGDSDMVTRISGELCSPSFIADADCTAWGYHESDGLMTDVNALRQRGVTASCVNMSCGYYEPHTDREITDIEDLRKCYAFVCHLIEDCTGDYTFSSSASQWTDSYCTKWFDTWEYDECLDFCYELLDKNPTLTYDEFASIASERYIHLKPVDFEDAYVCAKTYIQPQEE